MQKNSFGILFSLEGEQDNEKAGLPGHTDSSAVCGYVVFYKSNSLRPVFRPFLFACFRPSMKAVFYCYALYDQQPENENAGHSRLFNDMVQRWHKANRSYSIALFAF